MSGYIIVTGGSRGIGNKIVQKLLSSKRHVIYTYHSNDSAHPQLELLAEKNQVNCVKYRIDHSKSDEVNKFHEWTLEKQYKISGLINNAGISHNNLVLNMTDEEWQSVINVNLSGTFYMVRAFSQTLIKQQSGFLIHIASTRGIDGGVGLSNYAASKGGLISFAKSVGMELARFGIRNYILAPGYIQTDMLADIDAVKMKSILKSIQMKRVGYAEEIAEMIFFLIDKEHYLQNTVIRIDGGLQGV